ncbi:ankyrin repeat-containing domain protein, partial [Corynascus similis CBS 632.67]
YADLEQQIRFSGSSVNAKDAFGHTALWWAALKGDVNSASTLLLNGADHKIADNIRSTPMHAAVQSGNVEVVKLLLQYGADATAVDSWGSTTMMFAIWHNDFSLIDPLLTEGVDIHARDKCLGQTALSFAAKNNQADSARFLLQLGAELDAKDDYGDSPLFLSVHGKCPDSTRVLVEAGANIGLRNKCGQTILHYAAKFGTETTMRFLESRGLSGLDVHVRDKEGKT